MKPLVLLARFPRVATRDKASSGERRFSKPFNISHFRPDNFPLHRPPSRLQRAPTNQPTMAANTKYTAAPTRDSFDEPSYSQAPPSYQAEPVMGEARSEDDNLPDDFKFGGSVAEATLPIRMQFIRKVYAILTVQLLATTALSAVSFFSVGYKNWIQSNQWMMWVSLFGAIGFMLLTFWKRKSYPMNLAFLTGFTAMEVRMQSVR